MIKVLYNSERRRKAFITKELKQKKIAGDNWITSYFISLILYLINQFHIINP